MENERGGTCPDNFGHPHDFSLREDGHCSYCGYDPEGPSAPEIAAQQAFDELKPAVCLYVLQDRDAPTFQLRVRKWMMACFGMRVASDKNIRNRRFFEEATELVQACGMRREEAHELVDYVYNRPVGEIKQEIGGTMTTLAALCLAQDADMDEAADTELSRNWGNIEKIRAKQASKPFGSALPQAVAPEELSYQAKPRNTEEWWDIPEWLVTEYASRGYEVRTKHTRYTKA